MRRKGETVGQEELVRIQAGPVALEGDLALVSRSVGIVLFSHGSGSSRQSPRNRAVARLLREAGLSTLLIDLLTREEDEVDQWTTHLRFDINLLSARLMAVADWLAQNPATASLPLGCFGASTGVAAALIAAAQRPKTVRAVVSRGGRPDLAAEALGGVHAPTLLIVGGADQAVLDLNEEAAAKLGGPVRLVIVAGATHLFEEPGAMDQVARLARDWFLARLGGR